MDVEDAVSTDGIGSGVESTETIGAPEAQTEESAPAAAIAAKSDEVKDKKSDEESVEGDQTSPAAAYTPSFKFNVLNKQHEIPKEFQALIKDEKSEKMVREIFEKAYGLDGVKTKSAEMRTERDRLSQENTSIKAGIDGLRAIYQGAVSSGNFLKMDDFFARLKIPEQHVLQYALAKVNLSNLPPEQRNAVMEQLDSDRRAEQTEQQFRSAQTQAQTTGQQLKSLQLDFALSKPDIKSLADSFDTQAGKPGAFREQVVNLGNLTWFQQRVDLSPEQAVQQVISSFGLKAMAPQATAAAAANGNPAPTDKKVIVRETKTIPNLQGRSSSPLKKKPTSIEDLKELHKKYAAEA